MNRPIDGASESDLGRLQRERRQIEAILGCNLRESLLQRAADVAALVHTRSSELGDTRRKLEEATNTLRCTADLVQEVRRLLACGEMDSVIDRVRDQCAEVERLRAECERLRGVLNHAVPFVLEPPRAFSPIDPSPPRIVRAPSPSDVAPIDPPEGIPF